MNAWTPQPQGGYPPPQQGGYAPPQQPGGYAPQPQSMGNWSFDARSVAPSMGFEPVPQDWYKVVIRKSNIKPASNNPANMMLELSMEVLEGPQRGKVIPWNLNLFHTTSQQAVEIAHKSLSALCHVTGVFQVAAQPGQDNAVPMLHNIPFFAFVVVAQGQQGPLNNVRGLKDINGNEPGKTGGAPMQQPAPPTVAPAFQPGPPQQPPQQPTQYAAPGGYSPQPQQPPQGGPAPQWGAPQQPQPPAQPPGGQWSSTPAAPPPQQGAPAGPAWTPPQQGGPAPAQPPQNPQWQPGPPAGGPPQGGAAPWGR